MGNSCCSEGEWSSDGVVELSHFVLLRSVGKGAFGKVRVVQHKGTKEIYALKYMNKEKIISMQAVDNTIQERKLLEEIQNNFTCNLRYAFQDDLNLYCVIDLMLGGDLRFHLDKLGSFSEDMIRLMAAETASGLVYLHSKHIVHRDLKPDNLLYDVEGHCHLTDFNIAVRFKPDRPLTAVAGSMAYMAPEILSKKGYYTSVDWWSLGVVIYELAYGKRPFRSKTNDGLTNAIMHEEIAIPDETDEICVGDTLRDFILSLMNRDIKLRLGCKESAGGYEALQKHKLFEGLDWELLAAKKIVPPFVPDNKKANFDATHELEELLLEDNPLKAKSRKLGEDIPIPVDETPYQKDMRNLEEKFTIFDHTKYVEKAPGDVEDLSLETAPVRVDPINADGTMAKAPAAPK